MGVPALRVRDGQPAHEFGQIAVLGWPYDEMPVVGHKAKAQQADRLPFLRLPQHLDEGRVIPFFLEDLGAARSPIEDVVNETAAGKPQASWHSSIICTYSGRGVKRKDSRPFFPIMRA